tara:strand:- start:952 stop:1509 length:558 start_codon:yes stop_codon:yes gene_type:complete
MQHNNFPTEWQQNLYRINKYSKAEMQEEGDKIHHDIVTVRPRENIVTYEPIRQKTRTLEPGRIIKPQVNKNRGFKIDKTEKPALMIVKPDSKIIEMTSTPGFSLGTQHQKSYNREFNSVVPKNTIIRSHREVNKPKIISQEKGVAPVKPKKLFTKNNIFDTDREITNYTPIHTIQQPMSRVYTLQ